MAPSPLQKIVSGGQSGVDRGALDAAIAAGFPHGGWCPRGRLAEDGPIDRRYQLTETESAQYAVRTERNVLDSDATLILSAGVLSGGTLLTQQLAQQHDKPLLVVDLTVKLDGPLDVQEARQFVSIHDVCVLNVAGPRESGSPGISARAAQFVTRLLAALFGEGHERP
ncbi:MAG: putative molybdenum carrier protein [Planctomycetes bacterium]|nr:putative molybdenum carrier protein [Planctomycetota bacterium]